MFEAWIAKGLKKPGKDQYGLADALGVDRSAVSKIVSGKRELKAKEIAKVAAYLEDAPPSRSMPVRYVVGAGQAVVPLGDSPIEYEDISGMWGIEAELAVVDGDSMWPLFPTGSRIIFGPARRPEARDHRQMRIVRLADERMLVKIMKRTSDPNVWTLESVNFPPIEDVVVERVAEILRIEPKNT